MYVSELNGFGATAYPNNLYTAAHSEVKRKLAFWSLLTPFTANYISNLSRKIVKTLLISNLLVIFLSYKLLLSAEFFWLILHVSQGLIKSSTLLTMPGHQKYDLSNAFVFWLYPYANYMHFSQQCFSKFVWNDHSIPHEHIFFQSQLVSSEKIATYVIFSIICIWPSISDWNVAKLCNLPAAITEIPLFSANMATNGLWSVLIFTSLPIRYCWNLTTAKNMPSDSLSIV